MSEAEDQRIRTFFGAHKYIELRVLDREVANKCREIHRETLLNLGPNSPKVPLTDCVHIATAILTGCSVIHSFDAKDMLKADKRFGTPKLRIEIPSYTPPKVPDPNDPPGQKKLFGDSSLGLGLDAGGTIAPPP